MSPTHSTVRSTPRCSSGTNKPLEGTKVLKCREGLHNKAFVLTMDNGTEVVAKLPNPNAGPAHCTTASAVATQTLVTSAVAELDRT